MPRVTIVTPCYRAEPYIDEMLDSVAAQTFTDWEHVVVDDGSPDRCAEIVEARAMHEPRLRLVRQQNAGVCRARNRGVDEATGDSAYVYFLDPDDVLEPDMLSTMVAHLDSHPAAGLAFCAYTVIDEHGRPLPPLGMSRQVPTRWGVRTLRDDETLTPFVSIYCWGPLIETLVVMRKSAYLEAGGWDESFGQHGEGILLFGRIALRHEAHFVSRRLYRYRRHPGQSSDDPGKQERAELLVVQRWRDMPDLSDRDRETVRQAERFRSLRLLPMKGLHAGWDHLRGGRVGPALRFWAGALRRYPMSLLPMSNRSGQFGANA